MKLNIRAFGIAKDIVGGINLEIDLAKGSTSSDLRVCLLEKYPGFRSLAAVKLAVNEEYAKGHEVLSEVDSIAIIPPVSGG